jgi:hypothetical protein
MIDRKRRREGRREGREEEYNMVCNGDGIDRGKWRRDRMIGMRGGGGDEGGAR